MNEIDALRQEAETLKNAIRVSISPLILFLVIKSTRSPSHLFRLKKKRFI